MIDAQSKIIQVLVVRVLNENPSLSRCKIQMHRYHIIDVDVNGDLVGHGEPSWVVLWLIDEEKMGFLPNGSIGVALRSLTMTMVQRPFFRLDLRARSHLVPMHFSIVPRYFGRLARPFLTNAAASRVGTPARFTSQESGSCGTVCRPISLSFVRPLSDLKTATRFRDGELFGDVDTHVPAHAHVRARVDPSLALWLLSCAGVVFVMVLLGGLTRLTESGLSMVDWSLLHYRPPRTVDEWMAYFDKYKETPEYVLLNDGMQLEEFKRIYYMEYGHRMLGRFLGVLYFFPMCYFVVTRRKILTSKQIGTLFGIATLIVGQVGHGSSMDCYEC
jgi:hypothetical protein